MKRGTFHPDYHRPGFLASDVMLGRIYLLLFLFLSVGFFSPQATPGETYSPLAEVVFGVA